MTHVSKHKLQPAHLQQLFVQFSKISTSVDKTNALEFFDDLLGHEEKVMLAKRLAVIAMCIEGNSPYRISQLLYMSPSTTERIKLNYQIGKYRHIEKLLTKRKTDYREFWRILEVVLQAGMPPRGRGRWKSLFDQK
jgi:uncharacterized protein YerC